MYVIQIGAGHGNALYLEWCRFSSGQSQGKKLLQGCWDARMHGRQPSSPCFLLHRIWPPTQSRATLSLHNEMKWNACNIIALSGVRSCGLFYNVCHVRWRKSTISLYIYQATMLRILSCNIFKLCVFMCTRLYIKGLRISTNRHIRENRWVMYTNKCTCTFIWLSYTLIFWWLECLMGGQIFQHYHALT